MSQTPACPEVPDDFDLAVQSAREAFARRYDEMGPRWRITANAYRSGRFDDEDFGVARAIDAVQIALADRASRALPSTALAARPEEGWQPIETAPKDGTVIACLASDHDGPLMLRWFKYDGFAAWRDWDADWHTATHWMPLPPAPSTPPTAGYGHD